MKTSILPNLIYRFSERPNKFSNLFLFLPPSSIDGISTVILKSTAENKRTETIQYVPKEAGMIRIIIYQDVLEPK